MKRRLAAIMAADVVGYSRLIHSWLIKPSETWPRRKATNAQGRLTAV